MERIAQTTALLMLSLLLSACGKFTSGIGPATGGPSSGNSTVSVDDVEPAALLVTKPFDSSTQGALHGVIRIKGKVKERFPIGAHKVSDCCTHPDVEHLSDILVAKDGKLKYAYVSVLSGFDKAAIPEPSKVPVIMDQRGCIYTPHVTAMQTGQLLQVKTSDPTTHNVNLSAPANKSMSRNAAIVRGAPPLEFVFNRPDTVKLKCDIHPWMSARVHVSKHPWFAVTDDKGEFSIPNLPPGKYVIQVEHENKDFAPLRGSVTIEANESTGVTFWFTAK